MSIVDDCAKTQLCEECEKFICPECHVVVVYLHRTFILCLKCARGLVTIGFKEKEGH